MDCLDKLLEQMQSKKLPKFANVLKTKRFSLYRLGNNSSEFYISQVLASWYVGAEMIVNNRVISDYTKIKLLTNLFRQSSLNEIHKYNESLWLILRQTELFK